jgi:pyruvate,water dikinase
MDTSPAEKEREGKVAAQRAEFELFSRIPEDLHFFFHEVIRLARSYTSLDDLEHYQTTRLNLPLRRGLRELGQRLVARGVIADPMDIFMARITQIREAVAAGSDSAWATLGEATRRQKAAYLADAAREPEWVLGQAPEAKSAGDSLTGLPGSPGEAEGTVFLVLGPDDFPKFPKGSVLVARTTNPAWTPLFYGAIAVITESGGPLSHGAVTAREMGLPAVMAVKGCLGVLKNGMRVRVDGSRGRVHLLSA